ncbi:hypothetical protein UYO_3089, partial [Lachnospiraceae bacterium JC7]
MARKIKMGAGYRQRKDGRIEYRWTDKETGKRYSVSGKTIEECEQKREQKKKDIERNRYTKNSDVTLSVYFEEWIKHRDGVVKSSTIRYDKNIFKIITPTLGNF